MSGALTISRTLAIRLMHELQVHGAETCGLVSADAVHPLKPGADAAVLLSNLGARVWAAYDAGTPHPQFVSLRRLFLAVETAPELRGVLKMRCYENSTEQPLTILENT